ncbi:MAG: four helix bundle protein [Parcubacteria group bacterium CG08_land_8_20_14_0_20_38_56]|nr:MAG: four helix bundle protein [Parcubacteria group bacterium CG08_land_8_20_14_0_20_38_56]
MFDFENLDVYKKAKELNKEILRFLKENKYIDSYLRDQLRRASISMVINIAEGSGKFSKADKKNFYIIARGSVYECVSLFEIILEEKQITEDLSKDFYRKLETISKMLLGLINSQITH